MRKHRFIAGLLLTAICTASCKQEKIASVSPMESDSARIAQRQDSIILAKEDSVDKEQSICGYLQQVIIKRLYEHDGFLRLHGTDNLIIALHDSYVKNFGDTNDQALAFWVFGRFGTKLNGKRCKVAVKAQGKDWYRYTFSTENDSVVKEVKANIVNNQVKIDSFRIISPIDNIHRNE